MLISKFNFILRWKTYSRKKNYWNKIFSRPKEYFATIDTSQLRLKAHGKKKCFLKYENIYFIDREEKKNTKFVTNRSSCLLFSDAFNWIKFLSIASIMYILTQIKTHHKSQVDINNFMKDGTNNLIGYCG